MSEKHYPSIGGSFDRIIFDGDGSVWVPEADNAKLRELVRHLYECMCNVDMDGNHECDSCEYNNAEGKCDFERLMRELGVEVDDG